LAVSGVKPGDEVITATNTCGPTISAIMVLGAVPIFADAELASYTICISDTEKKITRRTKSHNASLFI